MKTFAKSMLTLAPLALLAACSGDEPAAPPPTENSGEEMLDVTEEAMNVVEAPLVMNAPMSTNDTAVEEPAPVAVDDQVRADADATGMTSRVDRDAEDAPATNDTSSVSEEK